MTKMKPFGMFATPYGIEVPIYRPPELKLDDPEAFVFDMDATAICAGIYDPGERARFVADANRTKVIPAFEPYGGGKVLRVPLPRPATALYPRIPAKETTPVEAWITGAMDHPRWRDRAAFLLGIIGDNMEQAGNTGSLLGAVYPLSLSTLLTASLEHTGDTEIDCVEAAAMMAVTMHGEWVTAGLTWLDPVRDTWFRDWRNERPRYAAFAKGLAPAMSLPRWLYANAGRRP